MSDSELIGRKHQELQALAYFTKKKLVFEYDSCDIPEFENGIRSRPDFLFRGEVNVIVEIDENAHAGYPPDDEVSRMKTIWKAFDKNVLFIRVAIDREKELSGILLKEVYHMILDYQSDADIGTRMLVHYVNYPSRELEKYRRFNGSINIVNFEDDDLSSSEEEDDTPAVMTTTTTTITTTTTTTTVDSDESKQIYNLKYNCPRCGYDTDRYDCISNHYSRKLPCKVVYDDVPFNLLKQTLPSKEPKGPRTYECKYCDKIYRHSSHRSRHQKTCKDNPNKPQSPDHTYVDLINHIKRLEEKIDKYHM